MVQSSLTEIEYRANDEKATLNSRMQHDRRVAVLVLRVHLGARVGANHTGAHARGSGGRKYKAEGCRGQFPGRPCRGPAVGCPLPAPHLCVGWRKSPAASSPCEAQGSHLGAHLTSFALERLPCRIHPTGRPATQEFVGERDLIHP